MRRSIVPIMLLLTMLAAPAFAEDASQADVTPDRRGTVISTDLGLGELQIMNGNGDSKTYKVSGVTITDPNNQPINLSSIKSGDAVTLTMGGDNQLSKVTVTPAPRPVAPATSTR